MHRCGFAAGLLLAMAPVHAQGPTVLLVGDSTMATRTGYGDALCSRLEPALTCVNLAHGGRSTQSYRAEGLWDQALAQVRSRATASAVHGVFAEMMSRDLARAVPALAAPRTPQPDCASLAAPAAGSRPS
jgi:hypothetical protein